MVAKIGIAVVGVVVLVFGGLWVYAVSQSPSPGDCLEPVSTSGGRGELEKVDCSASSAVYVVVDRGSAARADHPCPDGDYHVDRGRSRKISRKTYTCAMLRVKEGDCLVVHDFSDGRAYGKADCASAPHRVARVVSGKADRAQCDATHKPLVYSTPATTVCLTA
ncbi:hypothetical protein GCM10010492_56490 [Saccharothrix mutabilis subsp. mutabilis]|uniref:Secreted protein n=1 Tax=Saccharothrix mutabilis subsp. mutabilis TaxID=66855 RepID=A0ABN0UFT8_9PSEU